MQVFLYVTPTTTATYRGVEEAAALLRLGGGWAGVAVNDNPIAPDGKLSRLEPFTTCAALSTGIFSGSSMRVAVLCANTTTRTPAQLLLAAAGVAEISRRRFDLGLGVGWSGAEARALRLRWSDSLNIRYAWLNRHLAALEHLGGASGAALDADPAAAGSPLSERWTPVTPDLPAEPVLATVPVIVGGQGRRVTALAAHPRVNEINVPFMTPTDSAMSWDTAHTNRPPGLPRLRTSAAVNVACAVRAATVTRMANRLTRTSYLTRHVVAGDPDDVTHDLATFARLGCDRLYLRLPDITDDTHLRLLTFEVLPRLRELVGARR